MKPTRVCRYRRNAHSKPVPLIRVDGTDQSIFLGGLNNNPAYAQYHFACDYNGDGVVDYQNDYLQFLLRFGQSI